HWRRQRTPPPRQVAAKGGRGSWPCGQVGSARQSETLPGVQGRLEVGCQVGGQCSGPVQVYWPSPRSFFGSDCGAEAALRLKPDLPWPVRTEDIGIARD